jgi:diguanylate cyclase (GGDEF)-like protein
MAPTDKYCFDKTTQEILEHLSVPFAVYQFVDKKVVTLALSEGFCKLFGYEDRALAYYDMDNDMYKGVHPDDVARIANAAYHFATEGGRYETVYRTKTAHGSDYRVIHAFGEHVYTDTGVRLAHVWYSDEGAYLEDDHDSEFSRALSNALRENSILKASQYDDLTGLPNMTYFFELAEAGRTRIREKGGNPVLLYMNLIGMKFYNMKHGFAEGDKLLRAFSKMLAKEFGNESCCRISADHFAVQAEEDGLDGKLQTLFNEWAGLNSGNALSVHVGVYVGQDEALHTSVACDRAKLACTVLKDKYGNAVNYYSEALREEADRRQYFIENFDRAINEKWIQVYLQAIIRAVNGQVCDVESLARWIDPADGLYPPDSFIPVLEDAGLSYRLDLYMVDRVLEAIKAEADTGLYIVPHSVNLSRSDFYACDMIEEIRKRVDGAGVSRDRITIEITESIFDNDFEFIKEQVERFRELGFPVWMDDFGSGYSSLDILQSIRFDQLKFDRSFMQRFDEGENGRVLLTELMRMASSLGLDTVCEGVETEAQVQFLQEIGCSKLQGFYYSKPVPLKRILELHKSNALIANENPAESDYYDSIARANLYDLGAIARDDDTAFHHVFNTLPMAVLEITGSSARYIRSNQSYQSFMKQYFSFDILTDTICCGEDGIGYGATFNSVIRKCCETGSRAFFDETLPDGSIVHSFVRRISSNPVTGSVAVAVVILSISDPDENTTYADIAGALASDYYNIFVIDLDTNDYIEYTSKVGGEEMSLKRYAGDFFESARRDTMTRIYAEDREPFLSLFTRENVLRELDTQGVFTTTYRLIDTGTPVYVNMKITRMRGGNRLVLGVSIIDAHMKQQEEENRLRQATLSLGRVAALSPNYLVLYIVDPLTGHYLQYNPSTEFASFGLASQGEDFFTDVKLDAPKAIAPEDLDRHLRVFTKENILRVIEEKGYFVHHYRMIMNGKVVPSSLRAAMVEEADGKKIILGVTSDEEEYQRQLEQAYKQASSSATIYTHLAHALARGYTELFYVNTETDELIEFHTNDRRGFLTEARRSADFFEGCERDAKLFVHPEDQEKFVTAMNREFLAKALEKTNVFEMTYRRIMGDRTFYVQMDVTRMEDDPRIIVLAVSDIDELTRQRREEERIQEERIIYARLHAITGNFIVVYVVDPETDSYREFSATADYKESLAQAEEGTSFFDTVREAALLYNHPKDLTLFLSGFTKEHIMEEIERSGIFTLGYRIMMNGKPIHVQLKAAMVEEKEGPRLIVGLNDVEAQYRQEEELGKRLAQAQTQASIDALTGIKNRHAFLKAEARLDRQIEDHRQPPFAVVMLDVNELKKVNDTAGHQAGDQYLRDACKIMCEMFKHSPVFRVGGDEFSVIAQGSDYEHIEELMERMHDRNAEASRTGGIMIACGMSKFDNDNCVAAVFERADHKMYENKIALKSVSQ